MLRSKKFRDQHDEILDIVSMMSKELREEALSRDASEVRRLLSRLMGKLREHLSLEDELLYPILANHRDDDVRSMSKQFSEEMGHISGIAVAYSNEWLTAKQIQENPAEFISATREIFRALGMRIQRENSELYAALDNFELS